jgi:hypothetical protein
VRSYLENPSLKRARTDPLARSSEFVLLIGGMILDKLLKLSGPQFPLL